MDNAGGVGGRSVLLVRGGGALVPTPEWIAVLKAQHPDIDVGRELHRLAVWLRNQPRRRPAAPHLRRLVERWLANAVDYAERCRPPPREVLVSGELFDQFWACYPHRPGDTEASAMAAWRDVVRDATDAARVVQAARRYGAEQRRALKEGRSERRFLISAVNFLRRRRYLEWLQDTPVVRKDSPPEGSRRLARAPVSVSDPAAASAWAAVERAVARLGRFATVAFDDRRVHVAIERLGGWVALCKQLTQANRGQYAARFEAAYLHADEHALAAARERLAGLDELAGRTARMVRIPLPDQTEAVCHA